MKLLLSLCVVVCAAIVNATAPEDVAQCARDTNSNLEQLNAVKIDDNFSPSETMKNFALCVYKKAGIMNEDGTLSKEFAEGELASICKIVAAGKGETELVEKLIKCFAQHNDLADGPAKLE
uniref:Odorant-binding protein 26 n=1 Tax=Chouioia cunea TaxID=1570515 RepID=A0A6B9CIJ0_9HYME|nr:odorant-binding protein 26 [Chouioia cunea]